MENSTIAEGKTTAEAIENGLKKLKVTRDKVEVKVLENEEKRSFFSILTPRVVKVELKIKEVRQENLQKEYNKNEDQIEIAKEKIKEFLKKFLPQVKDLEYIIRVEEYTIKINIMGKNAGKLIGYRGETLNSMQIILSSIANRNVQEKIRVSLDVEGYKAKREESLKKLALRMEKTVEKTGKAITLEPMSAYERKIIHNALQTSKNVTTHSIGEKDKRRVVIEKIK